MIAIKATVKNGYLITVDPVNLPEGAELEVTANPATAPDEQMTEDNWPTTPEGIARLLARMESREPLHLSEEELARWAHIRREDKDWELSHFDERAEQLRKVWE